MTPGTVATAIKRLPFSWLRFEGNRHILIKNVDGRYVVQEAVYAGEENEKILLSLTGRLFELGNSKAGIFHSPILAGMCDSFTEQEMETEICVAKLLSAWGCQPEKFLSVQDGQCGKFKIKK